MKNRIGQFLRDVASMETSLSQEEIFDTEVFAACDDGMVDADSIPAGQWRRVAGHVGLENLVLSTIDTSELERLESLADCLSNKDWALHLLQIAEPLQAVSYAEHHSGLRGMAYATAAGASDLREVQRPLVFVSAFVVDGEHESADFEVELFPPSGFEFDERSEVYVFQNITPKKAGSTVSSRDGGLTVQLDRGSIQIGNDRWTLLAVSNSIESVSTPSRNCHFFALRFIGSDQARPSSSSLREGALLQAWQLESERLPEWAFLAWVKECLGTQRRLLRDEAVPDLKAQDLPDTVLAQLKSYDRLLEGLQQSVDELIQAWFSELKS